MLISPAARDLIVDAEVTGQKTYTNIYQRPTWPQGASGVTIGIGYDCGYVTAVELINDWKGRIPDAMIALLRTHAIGIHGPSAQLATRFLRSQIVVPWTAAIDEFDNVEVPKWVGRVAKALPNTSDLHPDSLGAVTSLSYNRGLSYSTPWNQERDPQDRYREMRAIRDFMATKQYAKVPAQIRAMKRLWPDVRGLQIRRDAEAALYEKGLQAV